MSASQVARRLVEVLCLAGVTDVVLAPGSRSGPIAVGLHAADAAGALRLHVRVDEREAAFLALGLAKASGRPVPVATTSGTAVANLHPAMLEALHAGIGLVAVTADRPARLRGTGANQTTDQRSIFPGVELVDDVERLVLAPDRPLQLNLELDEPLLEPVTWSFPPPRRTGPPPRAATTTTLRPGPRTIMVAGDSAAAGSAALARRAGWPLVAEPSSGARTEQALTVGRLLLAHPSLAGRVQRVVSVGHATLTRPVTNLLARTDVEIVHVGDATTFPTVAGPNVTFTDAVEADGVADPAWLGEWREADRRVSLAVTELLDGTTPLDVARTVWGAVDGGLLVAGSSNPIRDLDVVGTAVDDGRLVLANRGLAGIDGTISTAVGAALAHPGRRALALLGDLTFLHGANGLLLGPHEPRPDLTVVVANDDGGSIFATLEQGGPEHAAAFERVFATPTGTDLAALCAAHGVGHRHVVPRDLAAALAERPHGIEVVEVPVDRAGRRELDAAVRAEANRVLGT